MAIGRNAYYGSKVASFSMLPARIKKLVANLMWGKIWLISKIRLTIFGTSHT